MRERGLHRGVMPCWRGTFAQPITSSTHDLSDCKNTNNFYYMMIIFQFIYFIKNTLMHNKKTLLELTYL